ncbi:hypothetical protein F5I97DRAFT_1834256 [Phlebopus sp. FC_14]|nr:hypothetical protein F5I97DRAFT_1834256 [Phlebopus sp. FC_14]
MSDSKPTYIYKLISHTTPPPTDLPDVLPISPLDQSSGFVHLSTAHQVPGTLKRFFSGDPHVHILRLLYDKVEKDIKWEDPKAEVCGPRGGEGMFPHLYNGLRLGREEVESVLVVPNGEAGWEEALSEDAVAGWLVY